MDEEEQIRKDYVELREYIEHYVREEDKWHGNRPSLTVFVDKMIPFISLTMMTLPAIAYVFNLLKNTKNINDKLKQQ